MPQGQADGRTDYSAAASSAGAAAASAAAAALAAFSSARSCAFLPGAPFLGLLRSAFSRTPLLFTSYACAGCHSLDGTRLVGPSLKGIGARADKGFLKQSMLEPNAVIATDFPAAMPSFAGMLSAQQIEDLLAYLQSLR